VGQGLLVESVTLGTDFAGATGLRGFGFSLLENPGGAGVPVGGPHDERILVTFIDDALTSGLFSFHGRSVIGDYVTLLSSIGPLERSDPRGRA
jgi:hypothetical protein